MKTGINKDNIIKKGQNIKKNAQFWLDVTIVKDTDEYVPYKDGGLSRSAFATDYGRGKIIYDQPYAKYQFYGKAMKGKPRKATDVDLKYRDKPHRLAGKDWIGRAKSDHLKKWIDGLQKGLNTGDWTHGG